jgi:hypothetical protein
MVMTTTHLKHALVLALAAGLAACTVTDTVPPPLAGPSEMSLSLAINANPDVLAQDGGSQSVITVDARDVNGQPVTNRLLRVEIEGGDFGMLSARTVSTNGTGRATFTYTAPSGPASGPSDVFIRVTPSETDNANALARVVNIRLNPPGTINTGGLSPVFVFLPGEPAAHQTVRFDASGSTAGRGATITNYSWTFGDGTGSSSGSSVATHAYAAPGSYGARLTITDSQGSSATSATQIVEVGDGAPPVAAFTFSPLEPIVGDTVFFNAATSAAGPGHHIVSYRWDWGDGQPSQGGSTRSHVFGGSASPKVGNFVVVLTVTDEAGQTGVTSMTVPVSP